MSKFLTYTVVDFHEKVENVCQFLLQEQFDLGTVCKLSKELQETDCVINDSDLLERRIDVVYGHCIQVLRRHDWGKQKVQFISILNKGRICTSHCDDAYLHGNLRNIEVIMPL